MSYLKPIILSGIALSFAGAIGAHADAPLDARKLFMDNCAGCHQAGRVGTRFAPPLTKVQLGALSNAAVSTMIMTGITGTLMPPWAGKLSQDQIGALATLVRTEDADRLDWSLDEAKKSTKVLVDEKTLPAAPTYKADVMNLMGVMQRGRHAQEPESRVVFFDGATNERVAEVLVRRAPHILRYHPTNPRWAYVKTDTSEIYKIDLYSMQAVRSVKTALSGPFMAISWDGKWIAAGSLVPGAVMILNADTLEPVKQIKLTDVDSAGKGTDSYSASVTSSAVGGNVFTVAARTLGEVWIIEPNKPDMPVTKVSVRESGETAWWLYDGFTSEDQRYLYVTDRAPNNKIKIVDLLEKKYAGSLPGGCNPHIGSGAMLKTNKGNLYFSPNAANCSKGPMVTVWDDKGKLVKEIKVGGIGSVGIASHPDAPYIVVDARASRDGHIELIDKNTLEVVRKVDVGGTTGYPEYTRDGRFLYVGAGYMGDHLRIYDSKTFEMVAEPRVIAPAGTFAHARVLWGGVKGAPERPLGTPFDKLRPGG